MKSVNVLADNNIVNIVLEIGKERPGNKPHEEDRLYLSKIMEEYVREHKVKMFVNPSIKQETRATPDQEKKRLLLNKCKQLEFTPYNKTVFGKQRGFRFPAILVTEEEKEMLQRVKSYMPKGFEKDTKIFLDALANPEIDVLLTTDRKHLAKRMLRDLLVNEGQDNKVKILTPKEFYGQLQQET